LLDSGIELEADIIVKATGLRLQLLGGMTIHVNGQLANPRDIHCYKGVMFSGIPNFAVAIGYTNASWTLKCDLSCYYVTRILNYMKAKKYYVCVPKFDPNEFKSEPLLDFDAGYVKRAADVLPKQGSKAPWKLYQNYFKDSYTLKKAKAVDKFLEFR
jgi:cation diffusion facilitator CzcD-associated flavoprotein CzcO